MAVNNNTIMEKAWLEGTNDFQQRIPNPSQQGMEATTQALFDPLNKNCYNEFLDTIVNRIGLVQVKSKQYKNPLAVFKGGKLNFGSTIQELVPRWIKAHSYQDDVETLLKMNRPSVEACYHSLNRQDKYPISITRDELRMAFTQEFGLNNLVSALMEVPFNSDNYDEYCAMKELINKYENDFGFFKYHLDSVPESEETGKVFLKAMRSIVGKLAFPSTLYNAQSVKGVPVFARPEELVLLTTPDVKASLSVDVLASLFNMEKADLEVRTINIDDFPVKNAFALLTTKDWFVCHDKEYLTQSFYNGETLTQNYFLHHWEVISCSPFVPAILFTTEAGTTISTIKEEITGLEINASKTTAMAGETIELFPNLLGTYSGENGSVQPASACTYDLVYDGDTIINSRTYVDRNNKLHIQKNAVDGDTLIVIATSTYQNPSGDTPELKAVINIHIESGGKKKLNNDISQIRFKATSSGTNYTFNQVYSKDYELDESVIVPVYKLTNDYVIPRSYAVSGDLSWKFSHSNEGNIAFLTDDYKIDETKEITSPFNCNLLELISGGYKVAFFDNGNDEPIEYGSIFDFSDISIQPEETIPYITNIRFTAGKEEASRITIYPKVPSSSSLDINSMNALNIVKTSEMIDEKLQYSYLQDIATQITGKEMRIMYNPNYAESSTNWKVLTEATEIDLRTSTSDSFCICWDLLDSSSEVGFGTHFIYKIVFVESAKKQSKKKSKKSTTKVTKK